MSNESKKCIELGKYIDTGTESSIQDITTGDYEVLHLGCTRFDTNKRCRTCVEPNNFFGNQSQRYLGYCCNETYNSGDYTKTSLFGFTNSWGCILISAMT